MTQYVKSVLFMEINMAVRILIYSFRNIGWSNFCIFELFRPLVFSNFLSFLAVLNNCECLFCSATFDHANTILLTMCFLCKQHRFHDKHLHFLQKSHYKWTFNTAANCIASRMDAFWAAANTFPPSLPFKALYHNRTYAPNNPYTSLRTLRLLLILKQKMTSAVLGEGMGRRFRLNLWMTVQN